MSNYCPELDFSGRYQAYTLSTTWANREAWKYERALAAPPPRQRRIWSAVRQTLAVVIQTLHQHPASLPQ